MMTHYSFKHMAAVITMTVAAMVALTGCHREEQTLMSMVPVDRPCMVAMLDLDRLAGDFGVTITDGHLTFPDNMKFVDSVIPQSRLDKVAELLLPIDRSAILFYTDNEMGQHSFLSFKVNDVEAFDKVLSENTGEQPVKSGDYNVTRFNGGNVLTKDGYAWYTRMSADSLDAVLESARRVSLDKVDGVKTALVSDGFVRVGVMMDAGDDPDGQKGKWSVNVARIDGSKLAFDSQIMYGDGKLIENEYLSPMSLDFLRYVPDGMTVLGAIGRNDNKVTAEEINGRLSDMLSPIAYGREVLQVLQLVTPYVASVDGTVAFGLKATSPIGVFMMAHMPREQVNSSMNKLVALGEQMGLTPIVDQRTATVTFDISSLASSTGIGYSGLEHLTIKEADGYLLVTTFEADGKYNNSYSKTFEGKDGAFVAEYPLNELVSGCNFGVRLNCQNSGNELKGFVDFPGSEQSFVESFVKLLHILYASR